MYISNGINAVSVVLACVCTLYAIGFAVYVFLIQKWEFKTIEALFLTKKEFQERIIGKHASEITGKFYIYWGTLFFILTFYSSVYALLNPSEFSIFMAILFSGFYVSFFIGFVLVTTYAIEKTIKKMLKEQTNTTSGNRVKK